MKTQVYAQLISLDGNIAKFSINKLKDYLLSNNARGINTPTIINSSNINLNSYGSVGIKPNDLNDIKYIFINLDLSKNTLSHSNLNNFYIIEVNSVNELKAPLLYEGPRCIISPIEKALPKLLANNKNVGELSDRSIHELISNKNKKTNKVEPKITTNSISGNKVSNPKSKGYTYKFDNTTKIATQKLIDSGHNFDPTVDSEPTLDYNTKDVYSPFLEGKQPIVVPIGLKIDTDAFYYPESYTRIGYTKLLIPPQSINIRTDNGLDSVDVLRNQGSLKTIDYNTITNIEIAFSAIGLDQYNAVIVSLMKQINRTPFLPIENVFLNEDWDIDALTIKEFHVNTIDGLPGGVSARIIAEPFAWWHYLPDNDSFTDSICWPLFKMWCEDENTGDSVRTPKYTDQQPDAQDFAFLVPREESIEQRIKVINSNNPITVKGINTALDNYSPYTKVLDADSQNATSILALLRGKKYTKLNEDSGFTLEINGIPSALIKLQSPRNNLRALSDPSVKVFNSFDLIGKTLDNALRTKDFHDIVFLPVDGISIADKQVLTAAFNNANPNTNDSGFHKWFLIPINSDIWNFIIQGTINTANAQTIDKPTDFDELRLLPQSVITNISMQMTNTIASQQVQQASYPSHQYLGSGDAYISIQGVLSGDGEVQLMNNIVEQVRALARKYRARPFDVPYAGFLRIGNKFIQSLGLIDFIPLSLSVNTVEAFPGLYQFQLDLMEYKQSQKRREEFNFMDRAILEWSKNLTGNDPGAKERYNLWIKGSDPNKFPNQIGGFYKVENKKNILTANIKNPLIQKIAENSLDRVYRSSLVESRMRMIELYPDMALPSKKKLDYWIQILKYWFRTGKSFKDPKKESEINIMLSVLDYDNLKNYANLIEIMKPSNDVIGFAEPDFYCIPQIDPKAFTTKMLDVNFGKEDGTTTKGEGLGVSYCYDNYGCRHYLAPGKRFDEPETPNDFVTKEHQQFKDYQKQILSGDMFNLQNTKNKTTPTVESTPAVTAPFTPFIGGSVVPSSKNLPSSNSWQPGTRVKHQSDAKNITPQYIDWINEAIALNKDAPNLDTGLIVGVILEESGGDPTNTTGNFYGLMQTNTNNLGSHEIGRTLYKAGIPFPQHNRDLYNPKTAIFIGVARVASELKRYKGNQVLALAAYNAGEGAVQKHGGVPPFNETQNYVRDIPVIASWWNATKGNDQPKPAPIASVPLPNQWREILKDSGVDNDSINKLIPQILDGKKDINNLTRTVTFEQTYNSLRQPELGVALPKYYANLEKLNVATKKWVKVDGSFREVLGVENTAVKTGYNSWVDYGSNINDLSPNIVDTEDKLDPKFRPMFHDLQEKDFKGRLVGAFPTYCCLIIDGGRWIGVERTWDHLYGGFGINSIEIVQSRKDPVDVATVVFSNLYGKLTALPAQITIQKQLDTRSIWNSDAIISGIEQFFTGTISADLEERWSQWLKMTAIRPGARIHLRMGFGSSADLLPVKFNGVISQVPIADKFVQVIAVGDGVELIRPIPETDSHMVYDNGIQSPSEGAMWNDTGFLNLHGKEIRNLVAEFFAPQNNFFAAAAAGRWLSDNAFGITHFGTLDYSAGIGQPYSPGEVGVNLYTSKADPDNVSSMWSNWLTLTGSLAHLQGMTVIGLQVADASPWKVIKTCRDAVPDFICQVRPFEFRSTLFFGKDWFPYYYRYKRFTQNPNFDINYIPQDKATTENLITNSNSVAASFEGSSNRVAQLTGINIAVKSQEIIDNTNVIDESDSIKYEKIMDSKSFSQFHIICSGHNLIATNIIASSDETITNCQAKYIYGGPTGAGLKEGDLMKADCDIYPEAQKTKIKMSGILSGLLHDTGNPNGNNPIGGSEGVRDFINAGINTIPGIHLETVNSAANTSAAMEIRDSLADMYQGMNIIPGDPYINAWDYVYLLDASTLMHGVYQVKEVVNHFSTEHGYVTSVSPDCLVSTASPRDPALWMHLFRFGYSYASYKIWAWSLGSILRSQSVSRIQSGLIASAIGKQVGVQEKLLGIYKKIKFSLSYAKNEEGTFYVMQNQGLFDLFNKAEEIPNFLKEWAPKTYSRINSKLAQSSFGKAIGGVIERVDGTQIGGNVLNTIRGLWKSGKDGKAAVINSYVQGRDVFEAGREAGEAAKAAGGTIKEIETATKAARAAKQIGQEAKVIGNTITGFSLPAIALKLVFMITLGTIGDTIGRWLASRQCVVIAPLRVNNLEFSAGIEGHLGSVIGDPVSTSDHWFASIFSASYGFQHNGLLGLIPVVVDFILPGADSGWNPDNKEMLNNPFLSTIPDINKDGFDSWADKTKERIQNEYGIDYQYRNKYSSNSVPSAGSPIGNVSTTTPNNILGTNSNQVTIPNFYGTTNRVKYIGTNAKGTIPQVREDLLQDIEEACQDLGCRVEISSATRSPEHNAAIGGAPNSAHTKGDALDIARVTGIQGNGFRTLLNWLYSHKGFAAHGKKQAIIETAQSRYSTGYHLHVQIL